MFTKIDLCLLCLTNYSNLKSILSRDSDGVIIDEKLKFFISNQIKNEPEDFMLYICLSCLEKLNNVYNYKRLCLRNISRFNSFIHKLISTDEPCSNLQVTLIDLNNSNTNEVTCENKINRDSITTENCKVDNPYENETKHEQKPEVLRELLAKENIELQTINISYNAADKQAQEQYVIKEDVLDENDTKYELVDLIVKEEPEDNYDTIDIKLELQNDALLNETDNKELTCKSGSRSTDKCNKSHKSFKCSTHLQPFEHQSSLLRHKLKHSGTKPYKCSICVKAFSHKCHLETHTRRHTGEQPLKCDLCDKAFEYQSCLDRHKLIHSGVKPYKCDTCHKAFNQSSILMRHIRTHTRERSHKCDVCDKMFYQEIQLSRHKLIHSGVKPYKCDKCNKAFYRSSTLVIHKRCHTGEQPYKCDVCHKVFNWKSSLKKHIRFTHRGKTF